MRIAAALLALLGVFLLFDGRRMFVNDDIYRACVLSVQLRHDLGTAREDAADCDDGHTDAKYPIGFLVLAGLCLLADRQAPRAQPVPPTSPT